MGARCCPTLFGSSAIHRNFHIPLKIKSNKGRLLICAHLGARNGHATTLASSLQHSIWSTEPLQISMIGDRSGQLQRANRNFQKATPECDSRDPATSEVPAVSAWCSQTTGGSFQPSVPPEEKRLATKEAPPHLISRPRTSKWGSQNLDLGTRSPHPVPSATSLGLGCPTDPGRRCQHTCLWPLPP